MEVGWRAELKSWRPDLGWRLKRMAGGGRWLPDSACRGLPEVGVVGDEYARAHEGGIRVVGKPAQPWECMG